MTEQRCEKCGMPVTKDWSGWMHLLPAMSASERKKYRHVVVVTTNHKEKS